MGTGGKSKNTGRNTKIVGTSQEVTMKNLGSAQN